MIIRQIKHLMRQYRLSLVLCFIGLTCAFSAFMVISYQVGYELSFDTCHPTSARIYRADKKDNFTLFRNILPRGFSDDIIASSPHIVAGCSFCPFFGASHFTTVDDDPVGFTKSMDIVTPGFIDVFAIEMIEGDSHSLDEPNSIIIPESLADALFPGRNAVGQMIRAEDGYVLTQTDGVATVKGVYRDFPSNTQLENNIYLTAGHMMEGSYGGANFICYLLLDDQDSKQTVEDNFNGSYNFEQFENWLTPVELIKFTDIYFRNEGDVYKSGSYPQFLLLIAIAVLILLTGIINFTNFYIALIPMRMRSVNTRMVFGSSRSSLQNEVIGESLIWCIFAFLLALTLFNPLCKALSVTGLTPDTFALGSSPSLLLLAVTAAVFTGTSAGILPGIYSTSLQPALALKGSFGLSKSGRIMRAALVYIQITVSFILLIYILSIERQSSFMKEFPSGYDKDNLAVVEIGGNNSARYHQWLEECLKTVPGVENVAFASDILGSSDVYNTTSMDFGSGETMMNLFFCTPDFPDVIGLDVVEGSGFTETSHGIFLLSENLKNAGAEIRNYFDRYFVSGFVNTVNITSLRKAESYVIFEAVGNDQFGDLPCVYIRLAEKADRITVTSGIRKVLKEMNPVQTYDVLYYDSMAGMLYSGEERLRREIWVFSMLAILLSLVGIWSQTFMDMKYRRKEISIKRVMGASEKQIIREGLRHYMTMVCFCFILAAPFGYMVSERYLSQFARQTGISPLAFIISLVAVSALTIAVVSYHYSACLKTNPAEVLKQEA